MTTAHWLARRLTGLMAVWLVVSALAFGLGVLAPGDPAQMILLRRTGEVPAESDVQRLRQELGLDRPLVVRYGAWLGAAVRGELGHSYRTGRPVLAELTEAFPATLALAITALVAGIVLAIPLAILSARRRDGVLDHGTRVMTLVGVSLPSYWLAYLLILLFAVLLGVLPAAGASSPRHLVLPALTLGLASAAGLTRLLRANLLDELHAPYVRTALAKGVSGWRALGRHALRNALNPLVTLSGLRFGRLLGEAVIVESVFAWPGIGRWIVEAIADRDYPAIQGFVVYMAAVFLLVNLVVDATYRALDPRVRPGAPVASRP